MKPLIPAAMLAAVALAACNTDGARGPTPTSACFLPSDVDRWGAVDALQFWAETRRGDVSTGRLTTVCPTVDWSNQIAIQPEFGRTVCPGQRARLIVPDFATRTEVCYVDNIRLASPEEGARLKHRAPS
jgi:hypothetical protein